MPDLDEFGITKLYPTTGAEWFSKWGNGKKRSFDSQGINKRNEDLDDTMSSFHCNSYLEQGHQMIVYGNGQMKMRGEHPRLYINKPNQEPLWLNTEMTCYAKFTKPIIKTGSYTPFRLASRSNHHNEYRCICDGKGYATEIMIKQDTLYVKDARFRKELIHPHYANKKYAMPIIPMSNWVGLKFICKTVNNNVLLQTFIDLTDSANGGEWDKVGEFIDDGTNWPIAEPKELDNIESDCNRCIGDSDCTDSAPLPPYNEKIMRRGASCYLRSDFIQHAYFKKFSIREI